MKHTSLLFFIICSGFVALHPMNNTTKTNDTLTPIEKIDPRDVFVVDPRFNTPERTRHKHRDRHKKSVLSEEHQCALRTYVEQIKLACSGGIFQSQEHMNSFINGKFKCIEQILTTHSLRPRILSLGSLDNLQAKLCPDCPFHNRFTPERIKLYEDEGYKLGLSTECGVEMITLLNHSINTTRAGAASHPGINNGKQNS